MLISYRKVLKFIKNDKIFIKLKFPYFQVPLLYSKPCLLLKTLQSFVDFFNEIPVQNPDQNLFEKCSFDNFT